MSANLSPGTENRLLAAVPQAEYELLLPYLEPVSLELKQVLYEPYEPIDYVYFPHSGIVSLLTLMADGTAVETATVGSEGMVGLPVFLGTVKTPVKAFVQVRGEGVRISAENFRVEVSQNRKRALYNLLQRYTHTLMVQMARSAACNCLHSIEQRCGRWLLMTHDRVRSDQFQLTQEFLAQMLGVRRAGVSEVASALQKAGLIRYSRGQITVIDRQSLEAVSCECYRVAKTEFNRLLQ
ncbi:helix-turn-helix domain-containing protein [Leptolyngbya sp. FACHB-261]|uniref:Crp/Fnr family transcriptional regulator n=1 Tax=Leptolyngbya sp. FACHB-261 TaxID=2692806 RepID=UPI0016868F4E|nr:helix-turn-helix domain-containing protein [Leptolyngbya sp. FACHB-261]MBD2101094.1 Crp/Fnr family transcriptional regulator [Leptolyngbya sp. FACHB-261]